MSITYGQNASEKDLRQTCRLIGKQIKQASNIAILMHISPDMDCLGSAFGLAEIVKSYGKRAQIFSDNLLPNEAHKILPCKEISKGKLDNNLFDLIICVDTPTISRLGSYSKNFTGAKNTIAIDHHLSGDKMGNIQLVYNSFCSCAEIILQLALILKVKLTKSMATYLFAGLASDSSSFRNPNVTAQSYTHACILKKNDADTALVNDSCFRENTLTQVEMKKFLYNNYKIIDKKLAFIYVSLKDLKEHNANNQDCNTYSIDLLSIEGIKISCSVMQMDEKTFKISFRSRKEFDIAKYAELLGGGGHKNAAGAILSNCTAEFARQNSIEVMKKCLQNARREN